MLELNMADNGSKKPVYLALAGALVAGAIAGGLALYVTGGLSGNTVASAPEAGGSCEIDATMRAAVGEALPDLLAYHLSPTRTAGVLESREIGRAHV